MRLSIMLEKMRINRPDEWTMDDFARKARALEDALIDARAGLSYIHQKYGKLNGVGFNRVEEKAAKALD